MDELVEKRKAGAARLPVPYGLIYLSGVGTHAPTGLVSYSVTLLADK
jgi:hypothetical protein